jgi:hypothetical protein
MIYIYGAVGIFILVLITALGVERIQIKHLKAKLVEVKLELQNYQNTMALKLRELESSNKVIEAKHKDVLKEQNELIAANDMLVQKEIQSDKELRTLRLTLGNVRVFNNSARGPGGKETTPTVKGNASQADPTKDSGFTGVDLFTVIAENNKNHLACVAQVLEWQSFWQDYSESVARLNNASH